MARKRRWGRLAEIENIRVVPTIPRNKRREMAFDRLPYRLRHLASWRRMHALRAHSTIRKFGRDLGYNPSSDLNLPKKLKFVRTRSR